MTYTAGYAIADITALKALLAANLVDGYARWVVSKNNWYGWNSSSSATVDDDSVIGIAEAPEVGRFLRAGFVAQPAPVPGFAKWYRSDNLISSGANVLGINDLATGFNASSISSNSLLITNAINSRDAVRFNVSPMKASAENYAAKTIYMVYKNTQFINNYKSYICYRLGSSNLTPVSNETLIISSTEFNNNIYCNEATDIYYDGVQKNLTNYKDYLTGIPSGNLEQFHLLESVASTSLVGIKNLCLASDSFDTSRALLNTDIAEVIIYPFVLSNAERLVMNNYFKIMYNFSFL